MRVYFINRFINFRVGDINGDGLDDLICKDDGQYGDTFIAQNKENQYFMDGDTYEFNFCFNSGRNNFFLRDFSDDGKDDLLCQSSTGTRQINISYCF